ncbi:hypothetical protein GVAV_001094 [Gurleya vavrai]
MNLREINSFDKKSINMNLMLIHMSELDELKESNTLHKDKKFGILKNTHNLHSSIFYYYKNLFSKNNEKNSFHGFFPLVQAEIKFKGKNVKGTFFVLSPEAPFNILKEKMSITLTKKKEVGYFFDKLENIPLPFVFLPNCELFEFTELMKVIYGENCNFQPMIYISEIENHSVMFLEPLTMVNIGLDYLIDDIIADKEIFCFLAGFVVPK